MDAALHIRIVDAASLETASDALGDASFDETDIRYDRTSQTFEMILRRRASGRLVPKRFLFFHIYVEVEKPKQRWAECKLTFRQVEDAEIRIEVTSDLEGLEYDSATRTVTLVACPNEIALRVAQLDGELADII